MRQVGKPNVVSRCSINFCRVTGMVSRETSILTTTGRGGEAHSKPSLITQPPTHHVSRETIAITKSRRES